LGVAEVRMGVEEEGEEEEEKFVNDFYKVPSFRV
jgi:hypothetical protein